MNRFLSIDDLGDMPAPKWLIHGLFEVGSLVMLAGPPASYKSFLALDWVLSMATKRRWHGRDTTPSKVLYVLGEGKASLLKRITAWTHYYNVKGSDMDELRTNFRVTFDVPQMASKASVDNLLAQLKAEGFEPDVIVVDTFARSFVGLDENSQRDTGLWVESADRLRQNGYTVIFLHHTAKNTEFGVKYRGSTAIMGAMDTAFTLVRDAESGPDRMVLNCSKQKDHDEGDPIYLQRVIVAPERSEGGSVVLVPAIRRDSRFTEEGQQAERYIDELLEDNTFESDRARARKLSTIIGISEAAAQTKVSRRKKEIDAKKILQNREPSEILQRDVRETTWSVSDLRRTRTIGN